jgi:hypothetical protein
MMNDVKISCKKSVFRVLIRVLIRIDFWSAGSGSRRTKLEKVKKFHGLKCWMQCFGAENISFGSGSGPGSG